MSTFAVFGMTRGAALEEAKKKTPSSRDDKCHDMRIKARCVLTDAQGKPILDKKTKAPRYGFTEWQPKGVQVA